MKQTEIFLPFIVLMVLTLAAFCDCFATTEYLATVAYPLKGTRFHDTITKAAVCKLQHDWLVRNMKIKTLKAPTAYRSCDFVHWGVALKQTFYLAQVALEELAKTSFAPDIDPDTKNDPLFHFDSDLLIEKTNSRLIAARKSILKDFHAPTSNYVDLRAAIGSSLHTIQDFYSHTNWIEMKKTKPNTNIALKSDLGIPIAPPDMPTCSNCKQHLTSAQKKDAIDWEESIPNEIFEFLGTDFNASNVYVCKNNILDTGHLTSGYYSTETKSAPKIASQMKCSHGGGSDSTVKITALGGINKDTNTFMYSPHYYLHYAAADVAVQATIDYLEGLRNDIKDEKKFGRLLGLIL